MNFYDYFFRKHGIRLPDHVKNPMMRGMNEMEFPKDSIYHYTETGVGRPGPASTDPLFEKISKPIFMGHITIQSSTLGTPREVPLMVDSIINKYHAHNRRFRRIRDIEEINDANTLVVYSYAMIPPHYRYLKSKYVGYYKWYNLFATIWKNIANVASKSDRQKRPFQLACMMSSMVLLTRYFNPHRCR